ncbi:MAG TPA: methyltransferase domain-containing protein [Terracidiphilus sp.]|jgi:ubiquinone/menaquinone biosynthesis C-methylase UbiE
MSLAMNVEQHNAEIVDQFTRQAEPFSRRHAHTHEALLELMAECAGVRAGDSLLDIACGPGIVSCFLAKRVAHVTGLDMVPAMLERARQFQAESKVENVAWKLGESTDLPFTDNTFDCAVTRFSFHHFLAPATALREMARVSKPGGTVLVADVAPSAETQANFNLWEILRDPSHTRALTQAEFESIGKDAGLELVRKASYAMEMDLEGLLSSSFPRAGDADKIRALFEEDIQTRQDSLGVAARREDGVILLTYPVAVLAWQKPI